MVEPAGQRMRLSTKLQFNELNLKSFSISLCLSKRIKLALLLTTKPAIGPQSHMNEVRACESPRVCTNMTKFRESVAAYAVLAALIPSISWH
jgi:hypothetical protein